mmetsp:Transcript_40896/g.53880  ORF Transcript_40896/g.53880 Transcript_40896/m.53880 type:complete len:268 (-) Transcript_40896:197-1000(-)
MGNGASSSKHYIIANKLEQQKDQKQKVVGYFVKQIKTIVKHPNDVSNKIFVSAERDQIHDAPTKTSGCLNSYHDCKSSNDSYRSHSASTHSFLQINSFRGLSIPHISQLGSSVFIAKNHWNRVINGGVAIDGETALVKFFNSFFASLFKRSSCFQNYFPESLRARSKIFTSIVSLLVNDKCFLLPYRHSQNPLARISRTHHAMNIRPWMFRVFGEVFLSVVPNVIKLEDQEKWHTYDAWLEIMNHTLHLICKIEIKNSSMFPPMVEL